MVRWFWVTFSVLLIWIIEEQGHTALAVGAAGVVWTFLVSSVFLLRNEMHHKGFVKFISTSINCG